MVYHYYKGFVDLFDETTEKMKKIYQTRNDVLIMKGEGVLVQHEGAGMYRILTGNGSRTTTELVEMGVEAGVAKSLSVQNTTLDDVFVHYTGRQLRDELQKAYAFVMPQRPGLQP